MQQEKNNTSCSSGLLHKIQMNIQSRNQIGCENKMCGKVFPLSGTFKKQYFLEEKTT